MARGRGGWFIRRRARASGLVVGLGALCALVSACGGGLAPGQTLPPDQSLPPPTPIANPANGNAPPARIGPAVGFDPITRTLVMFGGAQATGSNVLAFHPA